MSLPPLAILLVGICTVVGMIIVLRINAFIALITAAILVSLLAPGEPSEKISRVAEAFGETAGQIGIVIALAAVIGKCMMDSGAADRIVRGFLHLLGEKRAPTALMGSGFVLAVPVFFDTVFYLLVPLARSLYQRTRKNYLMYVLAIAAGGAITHTLVPPTPGPLVMADRLRIDIGLMILVGGMVALPAALSGIVFARVANRVMPVPMRQIGAEPDPEPFDDSELPSLFVSVLPVVLPVMLITTNTVLTTWADAQHAARLSVQDVTDWGAFREALADADSETTPAARLVERLPATLQQSLRAEGALSADQRQQLIEEINRLLGQRQFFSHEAFAPVLMPDWKIEKRLEGKDAEPSTERETQRLRRLQTLNAMMGRDFDRMKQAEQERFNRLLLEVSFPGMIRFHVWETPRRRAANLSALFGSANLALLLSAAIAIATMVRQREMALGEMGRVVETSLMSGGAIILITAGGGAFGEMLKVANVGTAIQGAFQGGTGSELAGMTFLLFGFGVAALLKVAQGSSTVAMITGSAMVAAMITSPGQLGFHPVYLATAIGGGSLMGSWMNDSGFWIFAKMSGLTEVEALKSWTLMLLVLGGVSLVTTMVLATFVPLI